MNLTWPSDFINKVICATMPRATKNIPDESINMCMTSPPYWGLRDYGVEQIFGGGSDCNHEWKDEIKQFNQPRHGKDSNSVDISKVATEEKQYSSGNYCLKCQAWKGQLGLEPTPEIYIEHLTEIFGEVKRVLKKEGTLWLNLGDIYGGSCQGGGDTGLSKERYRKELLTYVDKPQKKMMPTCLMMIPERLAWSLIQDGWILRNKIVWYKPNSMPSSVKDRFSNRWEYVFLFSKSQRYFFDLDAVREPLVESQLDRPRIGNRGGKDSIYKSKDERKGLNIPGQAPHGIHGKRHSGYFGADGEYLVNPAGKNPGDVFEINTQPFPEAHFAVFPEKLCEKPMKAGCPEEVCKKRGKARERIFKTIKPRPSSGTRNVGGRRDGYTTKIGPNPYSERAIIGLTSCSCGADFEGGTVLDPFCGAGTTGVVAKKLNRKFIGIDISEKYCEMARKRILQTGCQLELKINP